MRSEEIKAILARPAVEFTTGGFQPTNAATTSWLGRVSLSRAGETLPLDDQDRPMWPLLQLYVPGLPLVPPSLANTQALTVFVGEELPMSLAANGENWLVREYLLGEELVVNDLLHPASPLQALPLQAGPVVTDFPVWDDGGIPYPLLKELLALERAGTIPNYFDWVPLHYGHKLGGWPTFCQPGIEFSPGFEFVLQIASDADAGLNVVDNGTIFLAKNATTAEWEFYCDFH